MTPLCELAKKHRTDKGGGHLTYGAHTTEICHNYTPFYYSLFKGQEDTVKLVLEIGVNACGRSSIQTRRLSGWILTAIICSTRVAFTVSTLTRTTQRACETRWPVP